MQENNSENNTNKTPHKMARLAWPKAKYGAILAIIIIIIINLIYYKDFSTERVFKTQTHFSSKHINNSFIKKNEKS